MLKKVREATSEKIINQLAALLEVAVKWDAQDADIAQAQDTVAEILMSQPLRTEQAGAIEAAAQDAVARGATRKSVRKHVMQVLSLSASQRRIGAIQALLPFIANWGFEDDVVSRTQQLLVELRIRGAVDLGQMKNIEDAVRHAVDHGATDDAVGVVVVKLLNDCLIYTSPSPRDY